jgi:integrase
LLALLNRFNGFLVFSRNVPGSPRLANVADIYSYPTRLIVHLIYACGLRVCEPLNLGVKDLNLKRRRLHIHQSKGNKGRVVLFTAGQEACRDCSNSLPFGRAGRGQYPCPPYFVAA